GRRAGFGNGPAAQAGVDRRRLARDARLETRCAGTGHADRWSGHRRGRLHHGAHRAGVGGDVRPTSTPYCREERSSAMTSLDPIELEILQNALTAAAAEMDVTMWRTSRSTIVREMLDYSTAIFDAEGFNVAQSARIPQYL